MRYQHPRSRTLHERLRMSIMMPLKGSVWKFGFGISLTFSPKISMTKDKEQEKRFN